ncbi:MAG: sigma-70 family RNA polymerase sigma factor [Lachnospiraceae bacterium]|nr:sigma-70 family RNA polymerase sigma factor [Lachnospiraceae bacterium]
MELKDIFERQHKRVYRIAMLMLNNVSDAEDAVQNVFLKYIEKGSSFEDIEHEKAWFITVTRNYCKDQLKNFWKRNVDMGDIPEQIQGEEQDNELLEHIMKLPDKYKEVIYLFYYEDYSIREMSKILDRKESTIQTQLKTARDKLKKVIQEVRKYE